MLSNSVPRLARIALMSASAIFATALAAANLSQIGPSDTFDSAIYVSMGDMLLRNGRLYVDMWDNKDPYFYYWMAAERLAPPYSDYLGEFVIIGILLAAVALFAMSIRGDKRSRLIDTTLILWMTVVIALGPGFTPNSDTEIAMALSTMAVAFANHGNARVSGIVVAILAGFKLILAPIVLIVAIVVAW